MQENNNNKENGKRIARNTIYLYVRLIFTTLISLYTVRVVLNKLGAEDFGLYNVVGGIVTFLSIVSNALSSASQRFLAYDLGKSDFKSYQRTFSMLINLFAIFSVIALVLMEAIGPFYINHYLSVDSSRLSAAHSAFQFSLLTFVFSSMAIPYISSIIAHERMDAYAFITVIESILKLVIVYFLTIVDYDQLIVYCILLLIVQIMVTISYLLYNKYKIGNCNYTRIWDISYFKRLSSYTGWNLFGSVTQVMNLQGQAIVINLFFGPMVNAAKAVADKINVGLMQLSSSFYSAISPQIIKSYSINNIDYMRTLVLNSTRLAYFLLLIFCVPLYVSISDILIFWIGDSVVNSETVKFCQATIIYVLVNCLDLPITMAVRATGDIRNYQIVIGFITLTFVPLCVIVYMLGCEAYVSMVLLSVIYFIALLVRIRFVRSIIRIDYKTFVMKVLIPIIITTMISFLLSIYLTTYIVSNLIVSLLLSLLITIGIIILFGIRRDELNSVYRFIKNKI